MNTESNDMKKTLATVPPEQINYSMTLADLQTIAQSIAKSGMFGVTNTDQALALMLLCQAEGIHPVLALRRYHIIEGRPSYRADALQGEFEKTGAILWHSRTDEECAATFFLDKTKVNDAAIERAKRRYKRLKENGPVDDLAELNALTVIRTMEDAVRKKIATSWKDGKELMKKNWKQSPRQMLHARCLTEGVRALAPGIVAGVYTEDEIIDMEPGNGGANGETMTPKDRVNQAAANASGNGEAQEAEVVHVAAEPKPAINEVTEFNWRDVVCHVGKAEGPVLGKKIGELPPAIIDWLQRKVVAKMQEPVSAQDKALAAAVAFARKQPKTALWMKFEDEWSREDFFDAMKANKVFDNMEPPVTKFSEIPEDKAEAFLSRFDEAMKIVADHQAALKAVQSKSKKP